MKNIEWLKEEVEKDIHHVFAEGDIYYVSREHILGLIDQLDTREALSNEWIENHTACADTISHYSEEPMAVILVDDLKGLLLDPNQSNSTGLKEVNIKQVKEVTE